MRNKSLINALSKKEIPNYHFGLSFNRKEDARESKEYKKEKYNEFKSKLICLSCGSNNITFHHRIKETKFMGISDMINDTHNFLWEDVLEEIKKCDPLCNICHINIERLESK